MARDITSGFSDEISADSLRPIVLVKAEFDSGDLCLFTGQGNITFNGDDYLGAGGFLNISRIKESKQIRANNVTFELSAVDSNVLSLALSEHYQGRTIKCWFGVLDDNGALISDPYQTFEGRMDTMQIKGKNKVLLNAEGDLLELRRGRERRYTAEDQKAEFSGDLAFDFVALIQDTQITWGNGVA